MCWRALVVVVVVVVVAAAVVVVVFISLSFNWYLHLSVHFCANLMIQCFTRIHALGKRIVMNILTKLILNFRCNMHLLSLKYYNKVLAQIFIFVLDQYRTIGSWKDWVKKWCMVRIDTFIKTKAKRRI